MFLTVLTPSTLLASVTGTFVRMNSRSGCVGEKEREGERGTKFTTKKQVASFFFSSKSCSTLHWPCECNSELETLHLTHHPYNLQQCILDATWKSIIQLQESHPFTTAAGTLSMFNIISASEPRERNVNIRFYQKRNEKQQSYRNFKQPFLFDKYTC